MNKTYLNLMFLNRTIYNLPYAKFRGYTKYSSYSILTARHSATADTKFNEYLAGVIDGDGSLLLSKAGLTGGQGSLEITMDARDERCLNYIKHKLGGGAIKPRSGSKSVRFRLHNKKGMLDVVSRLNGLVRYPQRVAQMQRLCEHYGVEYISSFTPDKSSPYFSGIVDSDGTITCSLKKYKHSKVLRPQLTISVSSKNLADLELFLQVFNGDIYADNKEKYTSYK